jgi:hypothetical protein
VAAGEQLGDGAAGVVADDHGLLDLKRAQQLG